MPHTVHKTREEWLAARRNSIGASDTPTIMGESAYKGATLLKLYADKVGDLAPEKDQPESMEWGHRLEPMIALKFADVTGYKCDDPGEFTIFREPGTPFMHATPDTMIFDSTGEHLGKGVLQIKAPGAHFLSKWIEGPPLGVDIQIQAEMHSCGASWGAVAALIGGQSFRYKTLERNQPFIDELVKRCRAFWDEHIIPQVPPEAEAGDLALLGRMFPDHKAGVTVECTDEMMRHVTEFDIIAAELKREASALAYHEARLKKFMEHAETLLLEDGSAFTWKKTPRKGHVVKASNPRVFKRKDAPKK